MTGETGFENGTWAKRRGLRGKGSPFAMPTLASRICPAVLAVLLVVMRCESVLASVRTGAISVWGGSIGGREYEREREREGASKREQG